MDIFLESLLLVVNYLTTKLFMKQISFRGNYLNAFPKLIIRLLLKYLKRVKSFIRRSLSYRSQSIYMHSKSVDSFSYDKDLRQERVKVCRRYWKFLFTRNRPLKRYCLDFPFLKFETTFMENLMKRPERN